MAVKSDVVAHVDLVEEEVYAAFYISNLRTGENNQCGIVSGYSAKKMVHNAVFPKRLLFVRVDGLT